MSHYCALVLTHNCEEGNLQQASSVIDEMLSPFSEHIEVDAYNTECYCINSIARNESIKKAEELVGKTYDQFRNEYWEIAEDKRPSFNDFIKPILDVEKMFFNDHSLKDKPSPNCEDCNGTGIILSTYNPNSKWDWYVIGGRWTGLFDNKYDPRKDPRNLKKCEFCNGTGDRPGWVYYEYESETNCNQLDIGYLSSTELDLSVNEESNIIVSNNNLIPKKIRKFKDKWAEDCNGCNSCNGTGFVSNYFEFVPFDGDVKKVQSLLDDWSSNYIPYAIVTPEQKWYEKEEISGEQSEWDNKVKELFKQYSNAIAIVVDYHI